MAKKDRLPRREFLKQAAGVVGAATQLGAWPASAEVRGSASHSEQKIANAPQHGEIAFPRTFAGRQLKMIAFPLGGVGAGSLSLGGRGQLRDWEIFNRPNKGYSPAYAFPAIWAQVGNEKPVAHVLEARILPPYEGQDGLGARNSPGLSRLDSAKFTAQFPLAHLEFEHRNLPVKVELEAFSPFIPHEPDDSGLPVAILRYRVTNTARAAAKVSIAYSIDNPVAYPGPAADPDKRVNRYETAGELSGLLMTNPGLSSDDPMQGSFVLGCVHEVGAEETHWRGWPKGPWWNSPLLFWDAFSAAGKLEPEPDPYNTVGALSLQRTIGPGESGTFTFVLAWHFPNRTPDWCGWIAPEAKGKTVIGNFYATRFKDAWEAAAYTVKNLDRLEARTKLFAKTLRESTLPAVVKEAASANLSTLVSTTCFRTADGEFHGFEGSDDTRGCCHGNCTHVWNYETATTFLFPSFARSLRKASFGYSLDDQGAMRARQDLPDGERRDEIAATDGQMGQILHAYLDWKLSGDREWLKSMWPRIKKAMEFAWVSGGWDPQKSGVLEGVQNNTYDVAFFGPNPLCGIYYLGALRAAEEMARTVGDQTSANEYRHIFERGSKWIDANLFNGEFYIQQIKGFHMDQISPILRIGVSGGESPEKPEYQVGEGCLIDQLMGQYLATTAGLGPLVSEDRIRKTLTSIYQYNYKRTLNEHNNVERTFALNDEAAMVICDYGKATRPRIPFPYFAEVMTGFEHSTAALMIYSGMVNEGIECIGNIRARYDGEKRNPWDEAECGHHYARAMASWTSLVATSGFHYDGESGHVVAVPAVDHSNFQSFWATGTGWGTFAYSAATSGGRRFRLEVLMGTLPCTSFDVAGRGSSAKVSINDAPVPHTAKANSNRGTLVRLESSKVLTEGQHLIIEVG